MPARFVRIGRHWINLDLVTSVEFVESRKDPEKVVAMRVNFSTGKHQDFKGADEVEQLKQFLESHPAE